MLLADAPNPAMTLQEVKELGHLHKDKGALTPVRVRSSIGVKSGLAWGMDIQTAQIPSAQIPSAQIPSKLAGALETGRTNTIQLAACADCWEMRRAAIPTVIAFGAGIEQFWPAHKRFM